MLIIYKNNHKANSQTDRPTRVERLHAKRIEEKKRREKLFEANLLQFNQGFLFFLAFTFYWDAITTPVCLAEFIISEGRTGFYEFFWSFACLFLLLFAHQVWRKDVIDHKQTPLDEVINPMVAVKGFFSIVCPKLLDALISKVSKKK